MDDTEIILQMMDRDERGLQTMLEKYGPKVKGHLRKKFGRRLLGVELDSVINYSAYKVWSNIDNFDEDRASLSTWFIKICHNDAVDLIRAQSSEKNGASYEHTAYLEEEHGSSSTSLEMTKTESKKMKRRTKILRDGIKKLPPLQKQIIESDLENGDGETNSKLLAERLGSTWLSIRGSRSKAIKTLRKALSDELGDES